MKTERRKMLDGELHDPLDVELGDAELLAGRTRARDLCHAPNATREAEPDERRRILGAVIGAGSVVTRDVPEGVFAAGNPCRVIREITE